MSIFQIHYVMAGAAGEYEPTARLYGQEGEPAAWRQLVKAATPAAGELEVCDGPGLRDLVANCRRSMVGDAAHR